MGSIDELCAKLDELGVEYTTYDTIAYKAVIWAGSVCKWVALPSEYGLAVAVYKDYLTPEQAIAATVGMEKWEPSKEWKAWHNSLKHDNPTSIREAVENILYEAIDFGGDMGPNGNVWSGVDEGTVLTESCIDGWVESVESIAATVGADEDEADARALMEAIRDDDDVRYSMDEVMDVMRKDVAYAECRSCASCPEMDNPDSYISLLQSALKWHNGYMSMPTNPRNTCVVLKGQKPPEEVLFVHDEGGVTHYLQEGTCDRVMDKEGDYTCKNVSGKWWEFKCSRCDFEVDESPDDLCNMCPCCGATIVEEEAE